MTGNRKRVTPFEARVKEGLRAKEMYAPVEILTGRQYRTRKNRELKLKLMNEDK